MGDIVNLRKVRKKAARAKQADRAAQNRLSHGRSKAERLGDQARRDLLLRNLDRHRLEHGEANEVAGRQTIDRDRRTQDERQS
ncbi:MAG: DUF4169 family protein [Pseudorhodoplanes sp.]